MKTFKKAKPVAKNRPSGSYAAGCSGNYRGIYSCRAAVCERGY